MPKDKPHRMNWPVVIQHLRTEANRDINRAADTLRTGDRVTAAQLQQTALFCTRLAQAFEAGIIGEEEVAKVQGLASRREVDTPPPPKRRGRTPGIKETKPRKKREPATEAA